MLAYAANRRRHAQSASAPHAMLLIVGIHIAAVAVLMSAKIAIDTQPKEPPLQVKTIPLPKIPPPPEPPVDQPRPAPSQSAIDTPPAVIPLPQPGPAIDLQPQPLANPGPVIGPAVQPQPLPQPLPIPHAVPDPVRTGPRFATPSEALRPPYPSSKIAREEEASLRLRLAIDARGRVTAVEPVGPADPAFLEAARRHLIAKWRYKPATEDGRPVASSTVITLRFQLEG